jgi:hypothetical protein
LVSPDDEHHVLETCRELEINKYTEKNLVHQVGYLPGISAGCTGNKTLKKVNVLFLSLQ